MVVLPAGSKLLASVPRPLCSNERLEGRSDILRSLDFKWCDFEAERASRSLSLAQYQHGDSMRGVVHHSKNGSPMSESGQSRPNVAIDLSPFLSR